LHKFRRTGTKEIPAFVTEIHTKVNITPETDLDDLILKSEFQDFLEKTRLDETCQKYGFRTTVPGQYQILENQIKGILQERKPKNLQITYEQAAEYWCNDLYVPVVKIFRKRGILRDFPHRTETDLYIWIHKHREKLQHELGWKLEPPVVATDITDQFGNSPSQVVSRVIGHISDKVLPGFLKTGPRPGKFRTRQERIHAHDPAHLFTHMLVPLSGESESWQALDLGLRLAWRKEAHLLGLNIQPDKSQQYYPAIKAIQERFEKNVRLQASLEKWLSILAQSCQRFVNMRG
jgi:hypothetical protein